MQTLEEKIRAIASVLWLLEDHYRMIDIGRVGACIQYERLPDGHPWSPPRPEWCDGWNPEAVMDWILRARAVSKRYRLWPVQLALEKLRRHKPRQAAAVLARYTELPPPNWYEPDKIGALSRAGLEFMARDIPGDMPEYGLPRPPSRFEIIEGMLERGCSHRYIAREVGCSYRDISGVSAAMKERRESTASAVG